VCGNREQKNKKNPKSRAYNEYLSALTLIFSFNSFSEGMKTGKKPNTRHYYGHLSCLNFLYLFYALSRGAETGIKRNPI
jgi:hypothetical protein